METTELAGRIGELKWFHRIDLGNGVVTPGIDDSQRKLSRIGMPQDLSGRRVLDVGAADGFFSFEAERRGASRIVAVDSWPGYDGMHTKRTFNLARDALGSKVESAQLEVLDIRPERVGMFDLVLFLGMLYHLRHPLLALERMFAVSSDMLILETHVDMLATGRPAMAFYPGSEASNDPTAWWGPNPAAVEAMLRSAGFRKVKLVLTYPLTYRVARAIKYYRTSPLQTMQQSRVVFHAWR